MLCLHLQGAAAPKKLWRPPHSGGTTKGTKTTTRETRTQRPTRRLQRLPEQTTRPTVQTPQKRLRPPKWHREL